MYKSIFLSIIAFLFVHVKAQDVDYARNVVKTLSSKKFKGRGYVGDGNKIAVRYIKKQFNSIGLKSFGDNYAQPFHVEVNTFPSVMTLKVDSVELVPGQDYIIDPLSASIKGKYPLVHIKKHELLDEEKFKSTLNSSAGKVLVIDEIDFHPKDKEQERQANELIKVLKYNPNVPFVSVIINTNKKLTWSTATQQASKPSFTVNSKLDFSNTKNVEIYVDARLINFTTENLIGYIEGTTYTDSFLVVTAHYDHLGQMGTDTYFPGANDNASGIAMLLSLAKHFQEYPPKYSIAFIATAAEEIGLLGVKHFVNNPLFDLQKIKFLVNFDLAGTGDEGIKVVNGSIHQKQFNALSQINSENNYLASVQKRGEACISDHCMFHEKGVPCFYIYTLGGIQAYHDIYDRNETLPLTEFADYNRLMIDFFNSFE